MYIKKTAIDFLGNSFISYVNTETGDVFPESTENRQYMEYLSWVEQGNIPVIEDSSAPSCEVK